MELSAHYYAVLAFCRASGFDKTSSREIASASQFVDDAVINYMTIKDPPDGIECDVINGKKSFFDMATCHSYFKIKTFNYSSMVKNTSAFHFVPGCEGSTFSKKMRCKEDTPVIRDLVDRALAEDDPVRFGICLHAFADTFSHQGFSGILSEVNDINNLTVKGKVYNDLKETLFDFFRKLGKTKFDKLFDGAMPAYGHGQALSNPDTPYQDWSYSYDSSVDFSSQIAQSGGITNSERYKRAFTRIKEYLDAYLSRFPQHRDASVTAPPMSALFATLVCACSNSDRIAKWKKLMIEKGLFDPGDAALSYDRKRWLKDAFADYDEKRYDERVVSGAVLKEGFASSAWYSYYRAVKWYKNEFFSACKNHGLEINI